MKIEKIWFEGDYIYGKSDEGHTYRQSLLWYPRLRKANDKSMRKSYSEKYLPPRFILVQKNGQKFCVMKKKSHIWGLLSDCCKQKGKRYGKKQAREDDYLPGLSTLVWQWKCFVGEEWKHHGKWCGKVLRLYPLGFK